MNRLTTSKPVLAVLLLGGLCNFPQILAEGSQYKSLEDFCLKTKVDTPENCRCGQARADEIMTPDEQTIALSMMTGNTNALQQLGAGLEQFMRKLKDVTAGCRH